MASLEGLRIMSNTDDIYGSLAQMVVIRQEYLNLTDKNICAASILDRFNAMMSTGIEYARWNEYYGKGEFDYTVEFSVATLSFLQCGIFTVDEVTEALNLLIRSEYIAIKKQEGEVYTFWVNRDKIEVGIGRAVYRSLEDVLEAIPEVFPTTEEIEPVLQSTTRNESKRVGYHKKRASRIGLPATLTLTQWRETLAYFNDRCALCPDGAYEVLEHFIPLIQGGGTTEYNCIPTCAQCNRIKHDAHPSMISEDSPLFSSMKTVQAYLETRRTGIMA